MLSHSDIWNALDRLARNLSTSPSGLARQAGLDPTTFNKSKRQSSSGKDRWPSTESLAKVLATIGMSFEDFARFADQAGAHGPSIPVIGLAQAGNQGFFDDAGFPVGAGWDDVRVPGLRDENVYCLQIAGDSMSPVLRAGDKILVAPNENIRKGDRVVVKTLEGEIMAKELQSQSQTHISLISLNREYEDRKLARSEIQWIARIVWVSQ
ncbi:phage repressor protein C with HTH and peptisase S24 domain [Litorimonas taeanensis]|uniref:Phage repressor protein C with HTH and peptisase S24 domain n=1 Tax=Litorimonas taeanensis TaxID=568099 RepID=A0A420WFN6_9PROT|nr:helix-turn-helix transcriptional regulator [Litorimonas taeanensis]RKQ69810.1 phage repressor protein C with HTH and peptisase S24 domain [Litorimonas taeanensis]